MLERMLRRQWLLGLLAGLILLALAAAALVIMPPVALICFFGLLGGLGFYWMKRRQWLEPLKPLGEPREVLRQIDAEIAAGRDVHYFGKVGGAALHGAVAFVVLTPRWLVRVGLAGIAAVRADDILWVFLRGCSSAPKDRPHELLGLRVYCRDDCWIHVPLKSAAELDGALDELLRRRPEIAVGYRDELLAALAEGPTPFAGRIDAERAEWDSLPDEEREARRGDKLLRLHDEVQTLRRYSDDPFRAEAWVPRPPFGVGRGWSVHAALKLRPRLSETLWALARRPFAWAAIAFPIVGIFVPLLTYRAFVRHLGFDPFGRDAHWVNFAVPAVTAAALAVLAARAWYRGVYGQLRRRLRDYGAPRVVIAHVDDELRGDGAWVVGSPNYASVLLPPDYIALTRSWLLQARPGGGVLIHLAELVWVYKRRDPGPEWLPWAERRYELGCRTRDGRAWYVLVAKEDDIDRLFEELIERRPALLVGWGGECLDLLEQGPDAVAKAYDARAAEFEKLSPEARDAWLDAAYARFETAVLTKE